MFQIGTFKKRYVFIKKIKYVEKHKKGVKMKIYKHMNTGEVVFEEDTQDYAMDQLGITVTPKGKNGELTQEQIDFISEFTEWFFSGNWFIEDEEDEEEDDNEWEDDREERYREYRKMQGF